MKKMLSSMLSLAAAAALVIIGLSTTGCASSHKGASATVYVSPPTASAKVSAGSGSHELDPDSTPKVAASTSTNSINATNVLRLKARDNGTPITYFITLTGDSPENDLVFFGSGVLNSLNHTVKDFFLNPDLAPNFPASREMFLASVMKEAEAYFSRHKIVGVKVTGVGFTVVPTTASQLPTVVYRMPDGTDWLQ